MEMDVTMFPREMLLAMILTMVAALVIETVYKKAGLNKK
jgi:hypothetical protein